MAGTENLALEVMLQIVYLRIYVFQILNFSQMYDVSNFQFLTAVPVNSGETWCGADYIQSNCVLVWSKVLDLLILTKGWLCKICIGCPESRRGYFYFLHGGASFLEQLIECPFSIFKQKSHDSPAKI